jgi:hypothetical protein
VLGIASVSCVFQACALLLSYASALEISPAAMLNKLYGGQQTMFSFYYFNTLFFFFLAVLGLELRAFTLSHSISPIFCDRVF